MDGGIARRRLIAGGLAVAASPLLAPTASAAPCTVSIPVLPWPAANDLVARAKLPVFPDRTFSVLDFETANARGGGHVVVPKGTFVTGAVYLKSDVDLHLAARSCTSCRAATAKPACTSRGSAHSPSATPPARSAGKRRSTSEVA
ncbi:hypothetical protein [Amycolatopsis sp. cmx-11-51]|uniref:hypothetical protein n=1 Tax=Amycolatopsis sp. cmx-11-51 TaxID=2785797 RepID=UPI0039E22831